MCTKIFILKDYFKYCLSKKSFYDNTVMKEVRHRMVVTHFVRKGSNFSKNGLA